MKRAIVAALFVALALPIGVFGDGAAIYKSRCTACHGTDGSGQTPVGKNLKIADLRSPAVQKMTDAEMTKVLADGKGKMPRANLSADEMKAVIAFVRNLRK